MILVLDTGILYAKAQPWEMSELRDLGPAEYVVPPTALFELDHLVARRETRASARAALLVLEQLVARGAAQGPVSCGENLTMRIATIQDSPDVADLDESLADDRILATALHLHRNDERAVRLVTTEFALHAKALATGVDCVYLPQYQERRTEVSHREAVRFKFNWEQVLRSEAAWAICRRGIAFTQQPLVRQVLESNLDAEHAQGAVAVFNQFNALSSAWTKEVNLDDVMERTLDVKPPRLPDFGVRQITEPGQPWRWGGTQTPEDRSPKTRNETADERALRISREQAVYDQLQSYIVDEIRIRLEILREYMLDEVGDELL